MDNGYATVQRLRSTNEAISQAWDRRTGRAYVSGFWMGLMLGLSMTVASVGLTVWMIG